MSCQFGVFRVILAAVALIFVTTTPGFAQEKKTVKGWPAWRGPNRDAVSSETGLLKKWSRKGPPLEWRIEGLGSGYSSVAIADGKIFTLGNRDGDTFLIALSQKDGRKLWSTSMGGGSPNCTPTVDGNRVYALGHSGTLICAETEKGNELWRVNFGDDFGGRMMSHWGYSESPLVDGDKLICTPGAHDAMMVALDKKTGKVLWKTAMPDDVGLKGRDGAGYSSVVISKAGGIRQYIQLTGRGLIGVAADDGQFLWSYNRIANSTANIPTPIISGDYVFGSTGYQAGSALLRLTRSGDTIRAREVYFLPARTLQNHHGGMVKIGDYLYCGHGHNRGTPICLDFKTGRVKWKAKRSRRQGQGSAAVLYADGNLYFRYQDGTMVLIKATPRKFELKGSFKIASNNGRSWPHPVIVSGRMYLRDQGTLLCYNVAAKVTKRN